MVLDKSINVFLNMVENVPFSFEQRTCKELYFSHTQKKLLLDSLGNQYENPSFIATYVKFSIFDHYAQHRSD